MKLQAPLYSSPIDTEGMYENVYIEDVSYNIDRLNNLFVIKFEMYHVKNGKRIVLDANQLSFKGTNEEMDMGLPTTNKTAILKVYNVGYNPETLQYIENPNYNPEAPETITVDNPNYVEGDEFNNSPTFEIPNPDRVEFIPNPEYVVESYEVPMMQYLYNNEGVMPEQYEVLDWGYPTYTNVMQYFTGGTLTSPELLLEDPFAKQWLKHNLQMKGRYISEFQFVEPELVE